MQDLLTFSEFGSLTTSQLMEKVKGLQNLAYQLGLDEGNYKVLIELEHRGVSRIFSES